MWKTFFRAGLEFNLQKTEWIMAGQFQLPVHDMKRKDWEEERLFYSSSKGNIYIKWWCTDKSFIITTVIFHQKMEVYLDFIVSLKCRKAVTFKDALCKFLFTFTGSSLLQCSWTLLTPIGCFSLSYTACHLLKINCTFLCVTSGLWQYPVGFYYIVYRTEVQLDFFIVLHFDGQDRKKYVIIYFYPSLWCKLMLHAN